MNKAIGLLLPVLLAACQSPSAGPASEAGTATNEDHQSLVSLVERNTEALGGADALDAVQTMIKRSIVEEGEFRDVTVFATDRQSRMRVDIFADGDRVFAESYDGTTGYQWRPDTGPSEASEQGTVALSHTPELPNHIFQLKDLAENGHTLEYLEEETIDGVEYSVLKLTLSDGFETFLYLETAIGLCHTCSKPTSVACRC